MAQIARTADERVVKSETHNILSSKAGRSKYRRSPFRLYFPIEAKVLRTPFRAYVLQSIYEVARDELGNSLKSAIVSTWIDPEEPVDPILLLTIVADADRNEIRRARKAIFEAIAREAASWTDAQKEDYSKMIYFDLEPLDV